MSWEYVKLNKIGSTYTGLSNKKADDFGSGKPYITYLNIFNNSKIDPSLFEKVQVGFGENQNKAKYGDVFFTTSSETPDEVGMCSVLLNNVDELYLNSFCFGFRPFNLDTIIPEYARYCFRSEEFRKQIGNLAQGSTRYNLSKGYFLESSVLITTDPKEQKKIADILESVDNSIESTQKAIEKYKLVKQGMMQDLLTRGIDENGKLRPSYEQAPELYKESKLGFIPKEWECEPAIKNICILNGGTPSTTNTDYWNGNIGWLSVDDFNTGNRYVYCSKKTITTLGLKNSSTTLLKKGMIIISARGTVGVIAQLGAELTFNQSCYGIDGAENFKNDFLYYCLKHNVWQTKKYSYGNVFDTITKDTFKDMHLSFPKNLKEQRQIADRLTAIDNKIETEQTYLLKLQKIKQGLVQDLLTGKVRCKF